MHLTVLTHPYPEPDSTVKYPLLFVSQHTVGHCHCQHTNYYRHYIHNMPTLLAQGLLTMSKKTMYNSPAGFQPSSKWNLPHLSTAYISLT